MSNMCVAADEDLEPTRHSEDRETGTDRRKGRQRQRPIAADEVSKATRCMNLAEGHSPHPPNKTGGQETDCGKRYRKSAQTE